MTGYSEIFIYYFSGTGNSRNVAHWISECALTHHLKTRIFNISNVPGPVTEIPPSDALILFVSPVHGFNYPPAMVNFIARFPKGKNRVILMNTRAGMLIGKFITPGLTGVAFFLAALFLKRKGYSIKGMIPFDLPSNWISVHPGLNERTVKYLHVKNKEKVERHAEKIFSGKNDFFALREIIQDVLISPVSILYYFIGRFVFAKTYFASSRCDHCDICIRNCPVKAIIKKDGRPFWTFHCESCMKCMSYCPQKAVETAHGFIFLFALLNSLVLVPLFYKFFDMLFTPVKNDILKFLIETSLFLIFLGVAYRIIHFSLRFRLVERFMVFTSLTWYKWWGRRYRALKKF